MPRFRIFRFVGLACSVLSPREPTLCGSTLTPFCVALTLACVSDLDLSASVRHSAFVRRFFADERTLASFGLIYREDDPHSQNGLSSLASPSSRQIATSIYTFRPPASE